MIKGVSNNGLARRWAMFSAVRICSILSVAFVDFVRIVCQCILYTVYGKNKSIDYYLVCDFVKRKQKTRNRPKRMREKSLDKCWMQDKWCAFVICIVNDSKRCFVSSFNITASLRFDLLFEFILCVPIPFLFGCCCCCFHVLVITPQQRVLAHNEKPRKMIYLSAAQRCCN